MGQLQLGTEDQPSISVTSGASNLPAQVKVGGGEDIAGIVSLFRGSVEKVRIDADKGLIKLPNGDCAEEFDVAGSAVSPGTVVVLTDTGALGPSKKPYDTRVAGVVSGAGSYRPGIILDRRDTGAERAPIALVGKVYCVVDATEDPVGVGDLLTTAERVGHAMRIQDPTRAHGAVLGKALAPLTLRLRPDPDPGRFTIDVPSTSQAECSAVPSRL